MTFVSVMLIIWAVLVAVAAAIYLYRSRLERDEEDQIFLDDSFDHERAAQEAIVIKVKKIEPALRIALWVAAGATLFVILYFLWDVVTQFK
ncbi:MAG: hypothetical protein ABR906_03490 [Terracidiphilus sp.]|jgi:hypothetical protein